MSWKNFLLRHPKLINMVSRNKNLSACLNQQARRRNQRLKRKQNNKNWDEAKGSPGMGAASRPERLGALIWGWGPLHMCTQGQAPGRCRCCIHPGWVCADTDSGVSTQERYMTWEEKSKVTNTWQELEWNLKTGNHDIRFLSLSLTLGISYRKPKKR